MRTYTQSYNHRKRILAATIVAVLATLFIFLVPDHFSFALENKSTTLVSLLRQAQTEMQGYQLDISKGFMERFDEMDDVMQAMADSGYGDAFKDTIIAIAQFLVIIHLLLNIIQEAQKGEATTEMWLRIFTTMAISLFLISNCEILFDSIEQFGNGVFQAIESSIKEGEEEDEAITDGEKRKCDYYTLCWLIGKKNADVLIEQVGTMNTRNDTAKQVIDGNSKYKDFKNKSYADIEEAAAGTDTNSGLAKELKAEIDKEIKKAQKEKSSSKKSSGKKSGGKSDDKEVQLDYYEWDDLIAAATVTNPAAFNTDEGDSTTGSSGSSTSATPSGETSNASDENKQAVTAGSTELNDQDINWAEAHSKLATMSSLALLQIAMNCVVDGLIYMLAIQIFIRKLVAPLAISDISIEGTRSTGMRYIKHFFALFVQKALILIIGIFGTAVMTQALTGGIITKYTSNGKAGIPQIFLFMTVSGCITGMMTQAGSLANEIVGD